MSLSNRFIAFCCVSSITPEISRWVHSSLHQQKFQTQSKLIPPRLYTLPSLHPRNQDHYIRNEHMCNSRHDFALLTQRLRRSLAGIIVAFPFDDTLKLIQILWFNLRVYRVAQICSNYTTADRLQKTIKM
jgi:hypothetical protein